MSSTPEVFENCAWLRARACETSDAVAAMMTEGCGAAADDDGPSLVPRLGEPLGGKWTTYRG